MDSVAETAALYATILTNTVHFQLKRSPRSLYFRRTFFRFLLSKRSAKKSPLFPSQHSLPRSTDTVFKHPLDPPRKRWSSVYEKLSPPSQLGTDSSGSTSLPAQLPARAQESQARGRAGASTPKDGPPDSLSCVVTLTCHLGAVSSPFSASSDPVHIQNQCPGRRSPFFTNQHLEARRVLFSVGQTFNQSLTMI